MALFRAMDSDNKGYINEEDLISYFEEEKKALLRRGKEEQDQDLLRFQRRKTLPQVVIQEFVATDQEDESQVCDSIHFTSKGLKECSVHTHHHIDSFGELEGKKQL